jgi:hypothetical protein
MEKLDIDDLENLNNITELRVSGTGDRGPLTSIPKNICRLENLKVNI